MTPMSHLNSPSRGKLESQQSHCHLCTMFLHNWVSERSLRENFLKSLLFSRWTQACIQAHSSVSRAWAGLKLPLAPLDRFPSGFRQRKVQESVGAESGPEDKSLRPLVLDQNSKTNPRWPGVLQSALSWRIGLSVPTPCCHIVNSATLGVGSYIEFIFLL